MIDQDKKRQKAEQIQKTRRRMHVVIDPENYEYRPEKKPVDYYDNDIRQNVGIYVRVSTDDVRQTTSYPFFEVLLYPPFLILAGGATFLLCVGGQDRHHQFAFRTHGMDVLFLEINIHTKALQFPDRLQQGYCISRQARNGFGDHQVHLNVVFDTK